MTPKEKAEELLNKYKEMLPFNKIHRQKQCALTAVEEILQTNPTIKGTSDDLLTQIVQTKAYYIQVAQELIKL